MAAPVRTDVPPKNLAGLVALAFVSSWRAWLPSSLVSDDVGAPPEATGAHGVMGLTAASCGRDNHNVACQLLRA